MDPRINRLEGHAPSCPKYLAADCADALQNHRGETEAHLRLKRLALLWAQAHGYSASALEVRVPRCGYRVDVAAYRLERNGVGSTAIFECKQAFLDLRRDNGSTETIRQRLEKVYQRRQLLEKNLRIHYPELRIADSLFTEFDSHDFAAINHRGYARMTRELAALQNRLFDCTKFEKLVRYRCANLFYLVLPQDLYRESEIPAGWGALVESDDTLALVRKPVWQDSSPENRLHFLERIAMAGTRVLNRELAITFDEVSAVRCRSCPS
jgi:hypothetical protein